MGVKVLWKSYGEVEELHSHNSACLWKEIRDINPLLSNQTDQIWRISVAPSEGANVVGGVLHCFGGNIEQASRGEELGFYIGMGGTVTFKNSNSLSVAAAVTKERLLLETDCPYLAPVPFRGKRNEPAYVLHVADAIAKKMGISDKELAEATTLNAVRLFNLPNVK